MITASDLKRLDELMKGAGLPWKVLTGVPPHGTKDELFPGRSDSTAISDDRGAWPKEDAQLVVALVNAAPDLLTLARAGLAAREVTDAMVQAAIEAFFDEQNMRAALNAALGAK